MTVFGFLMSFLTFMIGIFFLFYKFFYWDSFQLGLAPLVIGLFFGVSILIFTLGIIGEYVGFILTQVRNLPLVFEKERINCKSPREWVYGREVLLERLHWSSCLV